MSVITEIKKHLFTCPDGSQLLLEITKAQLIHNTQVQDILKQRRGGGTNGRMYKAKRHVKTQPIDSYLMDKPKGIWLMEFNFKAYPSVEEKRHYGYIVYDQKKKQIKELFCDCKDFFYRLYAPFVKNRLAKWNLDWQYSQPVPPPASFATPIDAISFKKKWATGDKKFTKRLVKPHNRQWTKQTNMNGDLYICKHLVALMGWLEG